MIHVLSYVVVLVALIVVVLVVSVLLLVMWMQWSVPSFLWSMSFCWFPRRPSGFLRSYGLVLSSCGPCDSLVLKIL